MSISSKLAVDFVKRNFNALEFESQPEKVSAINTYHTHKAYVRVNGNEIKLFDIEAGCTTVLLPEKLCCKLGLEEALKLIDKEDMDMTSYLHDETKYVRVTTNRLMMLEKLMQKSGLIDPIKHDAKEMIAAKIAQMQSEASSTYANTLNQLNELWAMIESK